MTQRHWVQNETGMLVTSVTADRKPVFTHAINANIAVEEIYRTQHRFPFFLYAFAVMPDHCHLLLSVPEGGSISRIMHTSKRHVSFEINSGPLWQRRFHCRLINDAIGVVQYIHQNPVAANLCKNPEDYPWSSACGKWDVTVLDSMGCYQ
jgi:putative transposase